jgi:hypothetical protein
VPENQQIEKCRKALKIRQKNKNKKRKLRKNSGGALIL